MFLLIFITSWMFGCLELFFFFQLHNNWCNAFLITEVEWTNHNTRNAIFRVEYLKFFSYLIVTLLTYYQIVWLLSGFKCQPHMTTIQPYICYLSFPFFTSFREAIADFLNDHMKPVEPILPENVCKIRDRYIRLKLPVPSLIVSINFPVGNRVNSPRSYTNMKIFSLFLTLIF